ncbi:hypothetical protein DE170_003374 [Clostridium acetobutylicum]|nr:hypothetical protein [Clostridium acetobutylicum]
MVVNLGCIITARLESSKPTIDSSSGTLIFNLLAIVRTI